MTSITVLAPVKVVAPRATQWAADAFTAFLSWFSAHRVEQVQRQSESIRVAEASSVRAYAQRFASQDPRFAADLMAAADRHETGK